MIEHDVEVAHPAGRNGKRKSEGRSCGLEGDDCVLEGNDRIFKGSKCIGNEGEEPEEGAERDEAVEVPCGLVRHHASMPFQVMCPGSLFFASVFVCLRWYVCVSVMDGQHSVTRREEWVEMFT